MRVVAGLKEIRHHRLPGNVPLVDGLSAGEVPMGSWRKDMDPDRTLIVGSEILFLVPLLC